MKYNGFHTDLNYTVKHVPLLRGEYNIKHWWNW